MVETQLRLSNEECALLVEILEDVLKSTRVEEHRTRTLTYREHIVHNKEVIVKLLEKLGHPNE